MIDVPVLIAGGGPVGLSASIMLSRYGVSSLLVERHPGTSVHPKARGINARTMEVFRQFGVEDAVRAAGLPPDATRYIIWARSLTGEELERRIPWRATAQSQVVSPVRHCLCAQDDLEPVLRTVAAALGPGELKFGTELTSFEQDDAGVTTTLLDRETAKETRVRARYLIAADGAHSRIRDALGIAMDGRPAIYRSVNILFHADLSPWTADRPSALYFIEQPGLRGTFLTINGVNRWGFLVNNLPADDEAGAHFTKDQCVAVIRQAAGVPDLDVEVLGVAPWVAAARVAERYQSGRVFLAGDAAHHMPPTGGFGMNTGIQDVHNLAWKLAAVIDGWAGASLLDSYEAERLPYGRTITEQSLINSASMGRMAASNGSDTPAAARARPEYLNEQGMIFGATYESPAIIPDGTPPTVVANPVTDYLPSGRPGVRAPHVPLNPTLHLQADGVKQISTLDLFGARFVLLAGPAGAPWVAAGTEIARALGLPFDGWVIGPNGDFADTDGSWCSVHGVDEDGAVLVRPDGHVAWRSVTGCDGGSPAALRHALTAILGRAPVMR